MKKIVSITFLLLLTLGFVACSKDDKNTSENNNPIATEDLLPLFKVNTNGNTIVDEPKVNAFLTIDVKGVFSQESAIGIEFRGSSSLTFPKKSYGFETRDANNEDLNVPLLNYPEEEDWILYGPYSDKSLIRNKLIYDLSRDMGRYASRSEFVELEINEEYRGVYVFMEKLKRGSDRIDINKLKEDENSGEDLTGGYILKIDKISASDAFGENGYNSLNSFKSSYTPRNATASQEINFLYEYPDAEDITSEQKSYISTYVRDFENALNSDQFQDEILGYQAYIDVDSFIDFFILNELSNNVDGYRLSTYLQKEKNEKLKMGPIWDFNLAFGNVDYCEGAATNVWAYKFNERCSGDYWLIPFWWDRLLEDPAFVQKLQDRWVEVRSTSLSNNAILGKISAYETVLNKSGAIERNFQKWDILSTYVWPNNFIGNTYDAEIEYIESWITARTAWLDQAINNL
tara:strand:- start:146 stop:1522 length:1377 start_codon:yes stop_codon:yes gene_type:complete